MPAQRTYAGSERKTNTSSYPCIIVIFGASGDLTRRKLMPALYNLECDGLLHEACKIVGYARTGKSGEQFRREIREGIDKFSRNVGSDEIWRRFSSRLHYLSGQYDSPDSYAALGKFLADLAAQCGADSRLYYLALPPSVAETVLRCMKQTGFVSPNQSRVMIEKPFGHDLASAQRMNRLLEVMFDESQVYRIDHYIAKDTVRNLLVFRFTNTIFEPLWNRRYIDNIQITAAEGIGLEGRGAYYEESGIVRDMVQNHVLQVMALIAMEPPLAGDSESVRDRKVEVFKSLEPPRREDFVFGQYEGYREEPKVDTNSPTPTFVALKLFIYNWRWQGVPFYIRSGKSMPKKVTEVLVQFKDIPLCILPSAEACEQVKPNTLTIRIQPDEGMRLSFSTRLPGREEKVSQANLDFRYSEFGWHSAEAYQQVLLDGISGTPSLFWRSDGIEAAWRVVTPLLETSPDEMARTFPNYEPGTWGPKEAEELLKRDGRTWLPSY